MVRRDFTSIPLSHRHAFSARCAREMTSASHGDALMRHVLAICDREHLPAYLESTNPKNISLYKRHGFAEITTIQLGSSPTIVPMLRQAR